MNTFDDGPRARITRLLDRFQALHPRVIDLSLGRVERLLDKLGRPQDRLPPVVHVAGTNGKGSTLAFLNGILQAAGRTVHAYTSPHLVHFNERIALNGAPIADDPLADLLEEVEAANGDDEITFFEITTAAAFLAFARAPADFLLLETGLGGRYDATNVVARPRVTAITPVSFDHQQFLGDALDGIAAEKAGIIKRDVPVVVGPQEPDAWQAIHTAAEKARAPLYRHEKDWRLNPGRVYESARRRVALPGLGLAGSHQDVNAATALALLDCLELPDVPEAAIQMGLRQAQWRARLQLLDGHPLARLLPPDWSLWLDGGHNPAAGRALADWAGREDGPLHLVVGMLATKEPQGFLAPFAGSARSVSAVPVPGSHAALAPEALVRVAAEAGLSARAFDTVAAALGALAEEHGATPARVLICGSLYLAGDVLARGENDINPESRSPRPAPALP